ncbi:MAG: hypothetical protein A4E53_01663 [Pelotomaculum sp. PtaB.Bin104]|nr:MAG: hypothetical protein A4E53_01663 [Pelotomaculum sp. PtaB.Bin104]
MLVDAQNLFSDEQAITAAAASENIIDLGEARDIGTGENLYVVLVVDTTLDDSGDDSTVAVTLQTDDNESFASAVNRQTLFTIAATAAAGTKYIARIQPDALNEQYARLYYTPANGNLSAGAVTAFLTRDIDKYVAYADNITIS